MPLRRFSPFRLSAHFPRLVRTRATEPYKTEAEVIEYLCRHEQVYSLARDIAKIGINPLEIFAVTPADKKSGRNQSFIVAEGNRRMCALKLLADPDLAPAKYRKDFTKALRAIGEEFPKSPELSLRTKQN